MSITPEVYEARLKIALILTSKFSVERYLYLGTSILSFGLIVYLAIDLYGQQKITLEQLAIFIGPTGFLAYAISRILFMWSTALKIILTGKP